jgi:hypothetical protein
MTYVMYAPLVTVPGESSRKRRISPLFDAVDGRQGLLSRSAARGRGDLPDPASPTHPTPHGIHVIPVPLCAHPSDRAIRVLRSPR